ncbi:uncharacterized protein LOC144116025 isoform X1 [Amblyomma americanum]
MDIVKPPEPLQFSGNLRRNWHTFKQKLELFFTATPTTPPRSEAAKTAILLSAAGEEALDVYNNFSFEAVRSWQRLAAGGHVVTCTGANAGVECLIGSRLRHPCRTGRLQHQDGRSPGELLQGRRLRTSLPEYNEDSSVPVRKHCQSSRGKVLPPLKEGSSVRVHGDNWSRTATVIEKAAPRSYVVKTENQRLLRRNRQHLLHIPGGDESMQRDQDVDSLGKQCLSDKDQDIDRPGGHAHTDRQNMVHPTHAAQETGRDVDISQEQSPRHRQNIEDPKAATHENDLTSSGPRKSTRQRAEPRRLHYDCSFRQIS